MNSKRLVAWASPIVLLLGISVAPLALGQDDFSDEDEDEEIEASDESSEDAQSSDVGGNTEKAESEGPAADMGKDEDVASNAAGTEAEDKEPGWDANDPRNEVKQDVGVGRPVSREDNDGG